MSDPQHQTLPNSPDTTAFSSKPLNPGLPSFPTPLLTPLSPPMASAVTAPPTYSPDTASAAKHGRHCEFSSVVAAPADRLASHPLPPPRFRMDCYETDKDERLEARSKEEITLLQVGL